MNGGECRLLERLQESGIGLEFLFEAICDSWVSSLAELEASMGWRSGQAYSQDLREHVLAAVDAGMAVREVATLFRVSISYIYKAMIRRRCTGETAARSQHGHVGQKLATIMTRSVIGYRLSQMRRWTNCGPGCSQATGCR